MKTVYFLGAGASKGSDFNLPTMDGFFRAEDFEGGQFPALNKFRSEMFPKIPIHQLNMEEVITHLELSLEGFGALWSGPKPTLLEARIEFDEYVHERLTHFKERSSGKPEHAACKVHKRLFKLFASSDEPGSILTLNYDLVCDYTLNVFGDVKISELLRNSHLLIDHSQPSWTPPPSVTAAETQKGLYLKLHGSLNWVYCPNPICPNHGNFFVNPVGKPDPINPRGSTCRLCGSSFVSVLIPPALSKSFQQFPKMGVLWNLAYRELISADKWIFIGMSLPPSDYHLTWLLREAASEREGRPRPQVEVANPDAEAGSDLLRRISEIVGVDEKDIAWHKGLKEYVDQLPT